MYQKQGRRNEVKGLVQWERRQQTFSRFVNHWQAMRAKLLAATAPANVESLHVIFNRELEPFASHQRRHVVFTLAPPTIVCLHVPVMSTSPFTIITTPNHLNSLLGKRTES
jgi:hypothetical protein